MPTQDTIGSIYKAFQDNPIRITYSISRLQKQFNSNQEQVQWAKDLYRICPTNYVLALSLLNADMTNTPYEEEIDTTLSSSSTPSTSDEWEVKQKWVKGPEGSQLMVKKDITTTDYANIFKQSLSNVEPYKVPLSTDSFRERVLMVYLADKHIGACTDESMYDNPYSPQVVESRFSQVVEKVFDFIEDFGYFKQINVFDLGDSVDGWNGQTTRGGHKLQQNLNNKQQFETYLSSHQKLLRSLIDAGIPINHHIVTMDNHSGDFGYICATALKMWTDAALPQISTTLHTSLLNHIIIGSHCFIITHGKDDEDMKNGLPLILTDKVKSFIQDYVDYHNLNNYQISVIKADLHQANTQFDTKFRYKNIPSVFGGSKWIANNFGVNKPGFSMEVFNPNKNEFTEYVKFFN